MCYKVPENINFYVLSFIYCDLLKQFVPVLCLCFEHRLYQGYAILLVDFAPLYHTLSIIIEFVSSMPFMTN